jgi:hypothetical protein
MTDDLPVIVNYGAGTNSTALLVEAVRRGLRVDAVLFADTGGEWPETYEYVRGFAGWLAAHGIPMHTVRGNIRGEFVSLEDDCLSKSRLPSKAYGFGSCSERWKTRPCWAWVKERKMRAGVWVRGIDADEPQRANDRGLWGEWVPSFPLISWGMGREECAESIMRAGLPLPGKSACFFCPSAQPPEVAALADSHPDLFARGLKMEARAAGTFAARGRSGLKGLGQSFAWSDVDNSRRLQTALPIARATADPCGCYEGARDADLSFAADYCGSWDHTIGRGPGGEWPLWTPKKAAPQTLDLFS